ncbi:hypothetical protein L5515_004459 [Caenorhabditis briggsae]|uniref:Uncharacterized protein n=1 Tax=Caenorhabditis briggsae TaxID=6238 RepID=A0AAE9EHQ4_CAEBR|nr:hypothetical protein L5515_004459 [Caenorhabditis briggsae]
MTNQFNYGPRMDFDELQQLRVRSTTIPSEYLDVGDSGLTSIDSLAATSSTSLGSHWKKIPFSTQQNTSSTDCSIRSADKTIPSRPATVVSSISSYTPHTPKLPNIMGSAIPPRSSELSEWKFNSESSRSSSSATIEGNPPIALSQVTSSLRETTEHREEGQSLQLQMKGLEELEPTLDRFIGQFSELNIQQRQAFIQTVKNSNKKMDHYDSCIEYLDEAVDDTQAFYDKKIEDASDFVTQSLAVFQKKEKIEEFVRRGEEFYTTSPRIMDTMLENTERLAEIRKNLNANRMDTASLTAFGQEDQRVDSVYSGLIQMIGSLPLDHYERGDFNYAISKIQNDSKFEKKQKCQLLFRHLMKTMDNWEGIKSASSLFDSDGWNSVYSFDSTNDALNVLESSSFALTDDSNLNDLDGELRSSRIRRAVEGPQGKTYECSPWDSASNFTGCSSDGLTNILSCNEPMTLSSYECNSSSLGQSTLFSVSKSSMPSQAFEEAHQNLMKSASCTKTACSSSDPIIARPPREIDDKSVLSSTIGTRTTLDSAPSLNFSTVSLSAMVDDALNTAKDAVDTQAVRLMHALQNSASKCGVALSDLMTAVSSSSESISDTQSSHRSITH